MQYTHTVIIWLPQGLVEMQKAQRAVRQEPGWDKDEKKLARVVQFTLDYCQGEYWPLWIILESFSDNEIRSAYDAEYKVSVH